LVAGFAHFSLSFQIYTDIQSALASELDKTATVLGCCGKAKLGHPLHSDMQLGERETDRSDAIPSSCFHLEAKSPQNLRFATVIGSKISVIATRSSSHQSLPLIASNLSASKPLH